jgi:hypothetical protein
MNGNKVVAIIGAVALLVGTVLIVGGLLLK